MTLSLTQLLGDHGYTHNREVWDLFESACKMFFQHGWQLVCGTGRIGLMHGFEFDYLVEAWHVSMGYSLIKL